MVVTEEMSFKEKLRSIQFAPSSMPTRHPHAARTKKADSKLEQDLAAYKRLRSEGLQPTATQGAAHVESHAQEAFEVETGMICESDSMRKRIAEGFKDAAEVQRAFAGQKVTEL